MGVKKVTDPGKRFITGFRMWELTWRVEDSAYNKTVMDGLTKEDARRVADALNSLALPIDESKAVTWHTLDDF